VLLVGEVDEALVQAWKYVEKLDLAARVQALHPGRHDADLARAFTRRFGANLEFDEHPRGILGMVARAVDHLERHHPDHLVAIVIPDALENRHATGRSVDKLRRSLRGRRAIVIDLHVDPLRGALLDPAPPRHAVLVPVNRADITTRDALAVAHLIGGHELHVVHFDRDDEETRDLEQKWDRKQFHSELEIVAAPDRILGDALGWELDDLRRHGVRLVTVVIPELIPRWWQQPLYSRDTKHLLRVLRHEHDVAITTVPHPL
jgi:hypothetical protein